MTTRRKAAKQDEPSDLDVPNPMYTIIENEDVDDVIEERTDGSPQEIEIRQPERERNKIPQPSPPTTRSRGKRPAESMEDVTSKRRRKVDRASSTTTHDGVQIPRPPTEVVDLVNSSSQETNRPSQEPQYTIFTRLDGNQARLSKEGFDRIMKYPSERLDSDDLNFVASVVLGELDSDRTWLFVSEMELVGAIVEERYGEVNMLEMPKANFWDNVRKKPLLLIPVFFSGHWSLVAVRNIGRIFSCVRKRKCTCGGEKNPLFLEHYDSLQSSSHREEVMLRVLRWIAAGVAVNNKSHASETDHIYERLQKHFRYQEMSVTKGLQDQNNQNCGWFTVIFGMHVILGTTFDETFPRVCEHSLTNAVRDITLTVKVLRSTVDGKAMITPEIQEEMEKSIIIPELELEFSIPGIIVLVQHKMYMISLKQAPDTIERHKSTSANAALRNALREEFKSRRIELQSGNVKKTCTAASLNGFWGVMQVCPPRSQMQPLIKAMRSLPNSGLVYEGFVALFDSNHAILKRSKQQTEARTSWRSMFAIFQYVVTNPRSVSALCTPQLRVLLQALSVQLSGFMEYVLQCTVLSRPENIEEDAFDMFLKHLGSIELLVAVNSSEQDNKPYEPRRRMIFHPDSTRNLSEFRDEFYGTSILATKIARESMAEFVGNQRRERNVTRAASSPRLDSDLIRTLPAGFWKIVSTNLFSNIERLINTDMRYHGGVRKRLLELYNDFAHMNQDTFWESEMDVSYLDRDVFEEHTVSEVPESNQSHIEQPIPVPGSVLSTVSPLEFSLGKELPIFNMGRTPNYSFATCLTSILSVLCDGAHEFCSACRDNRGRRRCYTQAQQDLRLFLEECTKNNSFSLINSVDRAHPSALPINLQLQCVLMACSDIGSSADFLCMRDHSQTFGPRSTSYSRSVVSSTYTNWRGEAVRVEEMNVNERLRDEWECNEHCGIGPVVFPKEFKKKKLGTCLSVTYHIKHKDGGYHRRPSAPNQGIGKVPGEYVWFNFAEMGIIRMDFVEIGGVLLQSVFGLVYKGPNATPQTSEGPNDSGLEGPYSISVMTIPSDFQAWKDQGRFDIEHYIDKIKCKQCELLLFEQASNDILEINNQFHSLHSFSKLSEALRYTFSDPVRLLQYSIDESYSIASTLSRQQTLTGHAKEVTPPARLLESFWDRSKNRIAEECQALDVELNEEQTNLLCSWLSPILMEMESFLLSSSDSRHFRTPNNKEKAQVLLAHGPPGTGKSTVARVLLQMASLPLDKLIDREVTEVDSNRLRHASRRRILVLCQANNAVDELLIRYERDLRKKSSSPDEHLLPLRLGSGTRHHEGAPVHYSLSAAHKRSNSHEKLKSREELLSKFNVLFSTLGAMENFNWSEVDMFDTIIIDEASHVGQQNLIHAMSAVRSTRRVTNQILPTFHMFVGDHRQNPPYVQNHSRSLIQNMPTHFFEDCFNKLQTLQTVTLEHINLSSLPRTFIYLNETYRFRRQIYYLVNTLFYGNTLTLRERKNTETFRKLPVNLSSTISMEVVTVVDTSNLRTLCRETSDSGSTSLRNEGEVNLAATVLEALDEKVGEDGCCSVGILTPYQDQASKLHETASNVLVMSSISYEVRTFASCQGEEYDLAIISLVRTASSRGNFGFLNDLHSACVALSRARYRLMVIGNVETFLETETPWRDFFKLMATNMVGKKRICYWTTANYSRNSGYYLTNNISKTIQTKLLNLRT